MTKQLILARFNENIEWAMNLSPDIEVVVYNKGDGTKGKLPNIGREAHTYLHHLCNGKLADRMAFIQADPFYHCGSDFVNKLNAFFASDTNFQAFSTDVLSINYVKGLWVESGMLNGSRYENFHLESSDIIKVAEKYFGDRIFTNWTFGPGACFGVSINAVDVVMDVKEGLLEEFLDYSQGNILNPIHGDESHVMERIWKLIFTQ